MRVGQTGAQPPMPEKSTQSPVCTQHLKNGAIETCFYQTFWCDSFGDVLKGRKPTMPKPYNDNYAM